MSLSNICCNLALVLLLVVAGSCSSYRVDAKTFSSPSANRVATFFLLSRGDAVTPLPRLSQRNPWIASQINAALASRFISLGLKESAEHPDIYLRYDTQVTTLPNLMTPSELRFRRGAQGSIFPEANPRLRSLQERSFTLYAYDGVSKSMIWRGTIAHLDPEFYSVPKNIERLMERLAQTLIEDIGQSHL